MLVSDLITLAVGLTGGFTQGEAPNASELADAFLRLNLLIDGWNADPDNQFGTVSTSIALTIGQSSYTVGTGGNFSITRPAYIKGMRVVVSGISKDLVPISKVQYNSIDEPAQPGIFPKKFYADGAFPTTTVKIHPVCSQSGTIEIDTPTVLAQFAATTDVINLPPGYAKSLMYNLAVDLAATFGLQLSSPEIPAIAIASKQEMQKPGMVTSQGTPMMPDLPAGRGDPQPPPTPQMAAK